MKASYSFLKYYQLTAKTNLNRDPELDQLQVDSNYELEVRTSGTNLTINHQTDELAAEAEINLWQSETDNNNLNLYEKSTVNDGKWLWSSQIIYNWKNSYLFNLGFKNLQLFAKESACCSSLLYTLGVFSKLNQNENLSTWGGVQTDFNCKAVENVSVLVGASYRNLNGVLNVNIDRNNNEVEQVNIDSDTATCGQKNSRYINSAKLNLEAKVDDDLTVYSSAELTSNLLETEVNIGGIYAVDQLTSLRMKLKNDYSGVVSLTKEFKNNLRFTMAAALNYVKSENKSNLGHVKTKFGVSLSFAEDEN